MTDSHQESQDIAFFLVREYLSSKGYKNSLNTLYGEMGHEGGRSSRKIISKKLGITKLVVKNKRQPPQKQHETLVELMTDHLFQQAQKTQDSTPRTTSNNPNRPLSREELRPKKPQMGFSAPPVKQQQKQKQSSFNSFSRPSSSSSNHSNHSSHSRQQASKPSSPPPAQQEDDMMIIEDCDFSDDFGEEEVEVKRPQQGFGGNSNISNNQRHVSLTHINKNNLSMSQAQEMYKLLFGDAKNQRFNDAWVTQGLCYTPRNELPVPELAYGLQQFHGGPCGVMAVVQAFILRELLFGMDSRGKDAKRLLQPSDEERVEALVAALVFILWQAGDKNNATVVIPGGYNLGSQGYQVRNTRDVLTCYDCTNLQDLTAVVRQNIHHFSAPKASGCVLLVYSVMLSRGLTGLTDDMDQGGKLIAQYGYCAQELVSLLITGRARTNVFNGKKNVDEMVYTGIDARAPVGFLSYFEHFNYIEVGSHLKTPMQPIWVMCSESHYSVLFGLQRSSLQDGGKFELYYYDELAKQEEEIHLSVDASQRSPAPRDPHDCEPPINDVIRTKWKTGRVDWNETEPIL